MDAGGHWGAWAPQYMDWKYWSWPGFHVPGLRGIMNDPRRFGWPLERATRMHAQLAAGALD
eukprot:14347757-Alexandrium_andersonii.AAC.1